MNIYHHSANECSISKCRHMRATKCISVYDNETAAKNPFEINFKFCLHWYAP